MPEEILVVDDEQSMRRMLEILLKQEGYRVKTARDAEEALRLLGASPFDLIVSDIRMPGLSGLDLLKKVREDGSGAEIILMTAYASAESAIEALKLGAFDYVTKPFQVDELVHVVSSALEKKTLREENIRLKVELSQKESFGEIIGGSPSMRSMYAMIERIAPTLSTVLIQGESGTGKELVARAIHQRSPRRNKPFISVNCGGIPETLLESELFGHVKGAFTGAYATKKGLFDMAHGGTLFLDEIGEMSPLMQVKLLRALQERRIRPVGATEDHEVDARVLAATNQDLQRMVQDKAFREDLYYRINVINLNLPALRDRREDIPLLVGHFLEKYSRVLKKEPPGLSPQAMSALESYQWPGNIRELENVIERGVALAAKDRIELSHLPDHILGYRIPTSGPEIDIPDTGFSLTETVEGLRAAYIRRALELEEGVMVRAAERLGISFRSMRYFVKKYHLQGKDA
ncbi:MAG: sigma-54 dependent transcriptional regulator [Acidobacteriota bacterium]|jgi:two-component system, NtrC family, response regulator PilR